MNPGRHDILFRYKEIREVNKTNIILDDIMELESITEILDDSHVWYYPTRDKGVLKAHSIDHLVMNPAGNHFDRYIFVKPYTKVNLYHFEGVPLFMSGYVVEDVPEVEGPVRGTPITEIITTETPFSEDVPDADTSRSAPS